MFHTLAAHDDLEAKREALAAKLLRPVYIVSATCKSNGTHFKRPRSMKYAPMGALELYLSTLTDDNRCVKRVKVNDDSANDHYYFDLREADFLHVVYPMTDQESTLPGIRDAFKSVDLTSGLSPCENVYPSSGEPIPPELEKYLRSKKVRSGVTRMGILFARSEAIATPNKLHERWHRGLRVEGKYAPPFVTLQAPGWYHGKPITTVENINRFGLLDTDPGPCTVCHGKSGDRRHIAPVQSAGPDAYLAGHLCRTCAKDAFAQWANLLDDATPI
jgi:hypothetical protein